MTAIQTSMRDIYARLKAVGLNAKFVRQCVLPEWWDDKLVKEPGMRTSVELILARHLGIPPSVLSDPNQPLELPPCSVTRFRTTRIPGRDRHEALVRVVSRAAELAARSFPAATPDIPALPANIRTEILDGGHRWVGLREMVDWCWSHGILVLRLARRPDGAGKVDGMALRAGGRPVIFVANPRESPAWLLFTVAHELGHIVLGHVTGPDSVVVDESLRNDDTQMQEQEANLFASRVLDPTNIGRRFSPPRQKNPPTLAGLASEVGCEAQVDPGYVLLQYGWRTGQYAVAQAAIDRLPRISSAPEIIRSAAVRHLISGELCADDQDFLFAMTGIEPMIAD